jgi:retinol-binding protein 3
MRFAHFPSAVCLLVALGTHPATSQSETVAPPDTVITDATRPAVLDSLVVQLDRIYIFPEVATRIGRALRLRAARHEYDALTSANALADSLTAHLFAAGQDEHLRVRWSREPIRLEYTDARLTPSEATEARERLRIFNFGFHRVQRLPGNVGYLDLRSFDPPGLGAAEAAMAAMTLLGSCDALIVDLRRNGGGDPVMADLLISYLYEPWERIHVNDFISRVGREFRTEQYWTMPGAPGPHLADRDVYVLTGPTTFSCAEEFAYSLQCLRRATIVGETTEGGANPGSDHVLPGGFTTFIPDGRAQNPISGRNWEGVGVRPDVAVPADSALAVARGMALERLLARATNEDTQARLRRALVQSREAPIEPLEEIYRRRD